MLPSSEAPPTSAPCPPPSQPPDDGATSQRQVKNIWFKRLKQVEQTNVTHYKRRFNLFTRQQQRKRGTITGFWVFCEFSSK